MAPNPQCTALAAAKDRSKMSYGDIAAKIGQTEQHVVDICTGVQKPTNQEFDALARALGISNAPAIPAHTTK